MKIGFVGCGNMASAIISGIIKYQGDNNQIFGYDCYTPALEKCAKKYKINSCKSESDVVNNSDIIFIAVKPNNLEEVLKEISRAITNEHILISICAGKTIEFIQEPINTECKIVRVMPNINAKVGEAISAYCHNDKATQTDCDAVENLLNCTGKVIKLDEKHFPIFGVIGGCAPAFSYMFIDELARAGVKYGMKKDEALYVAAQTVYGSAKMILESDDHPYKLIDNVCSPGGTTIEGVMSLQNDCFDKAIHNAVKSAVEKDSKL